MGLRKFVRVLVPFVPQTCAERLLPPRLREIFAETTAQKRASKYIINHFHCSAGYSAAWKGHDAVNNLDEGVKCAK